VVLCSEDVYLYSNPYLIWPLPWKCHLSYQARYQIHRDTCSKILLPVPFKGDNSSYKAIFFFFIAEGYYYTNYPNWNICWFFLPSSKICTIRQKFYQILNENWKAKLLKIILQREGIYNFKCTCVKFMLLLFLESSLSFLSSR
jgi:hypothetical protein